MSKQIKPAHPAVKLMDGCYTSKFSVTPKDWNTSKASMNRDWMIHYRFHDPKFKDNPKYKYGKLVPIGGMNSFKDWESRRQMTEEIIKDEISNLLKGYNPITKEYMKPAEAEVQVNFIISPDTPWLDALKMASERLTYVKSTRQDFKSMFISLNKSAEQLRMSGLTIQQIKRVHLIKVLENCKKTPTRQNKYRSYLHSFFEELERIETIEFNPAAKVPIVKVIKDEERGREILTPEQRIMVENHLKVNFPSFRRFLHIFFHSGCRETEIMRLQAKDVDLKNQRFRITILKGATYKRVWKPIKNIALPFWTEVMQNAKPLDYVFSRGLVPGPEPIRTDQITRRWRVHVKERLGITADFYALKHLNTDETAAIAGLGIAAAQNSHTSIRTTLQHYAVNEKQRQLDAMKKVNNAFV